MPHYYADLIGNITVTGHLVRIDFLCQATPPSAQQQDAAQQGVQFQAARLMLLDVMYRQLCQI